MHRDGVPRVDLDALGAAGQSIHNAYAGRLREHAQQLPHRMRNLHDGPHRPILSSVTASMRVAPGGKRDGPWYEKVRGS